MSGGVVDIGYLELFAASALMLVAGIVSWRLELGQTKRIVVSSVRTFVQLLAVGFVLMLSLIHIFAHAGDPVEEKSFFDGGLGVFIHGNHFCLTRPPLGILR